MRRRTVLAGGAAAALGGCGFHPLYAPGGGGGPGIAAAELEAVYVPVISERAGQLLREALQRRLEGASSGVPKTYELVASATLTSEGIAIQRDTSVTRNRLIGTANWSLRLLNLEHTVLTSGTAKAVDGYNIINQQYFAATLEAETVTQRVMEALADQIVTRVAIFLRRRATIPT